MKALTLLILAVFIFNSFCEAASVKPRKYRIAVKTNSRKTYKGIFYSINDTLLQLKKRNRINSFKAANVKTIAVYNAKLPIILGLVGAISCIILTSTSDDDIVRGVEYIFMECLLLLD